MLPVALARYSSGGVAIRYVFPVLRMTSCFHTMGPAGKIEHDVMFKTVCQVAVPVAWTSDNYSVLLSSSEYGTGGESAVYDCLVISISPHCQQAVGHFIFG